MDQTSVLLAIFDEAFDRKAWHGPNLWQSLKGVTAKQAAWRPAANRHNIWEETLHAAYWKYHVRRILENGKRGSFILNGSNFFRRPEGGKNTESDWKSDKAILRNEHERLRAAIGARPSKPLTAKLERILWGVAFHDIYHAGQIRLLRRLQGK